MRCQRFTTMLRPPRPDTSVVPPAALTLEPETKNPAFALFAVAGAGFEPAISGS
jgi:hypothetical protein